MTNVAITETTLTDIIQKLWDADKVNDSMYAGTPFYGMIAKKSDASMDDNEVPIKYTLPAGSHKYTNSLSGASSMQFKAFKIALVDDFVPLVVSGRTVKALEMSETFVEKALGSMQDVISSGVDQFARRREMELFRSSTGAIGKVGALSTISLTLTNASDAKLFMINQKVTESATEGGALGTGSATGEIIAKVDWTNSILTCTSVDWTTILSGIVVGHFLYNWGDGQNNTTAVSPYGLGDYCPVTVAANDSFTASAVNRSIHPALYGHYHSRSTNGETLQKALQNGIAETAAGMPVLSGKRVITFMDPVRFQELNDEVAIKEHVVRYAESESGPIANIGYEGFKLFAGGVVTEVYANVYCPSDTVYSVPLDYVKILSCGKLGEMDNLGGTTWKHALDADAVLGFVKSYFNLECSLPGAITRINVSTT